MTILRAAPAHPQPNHFGDLPTPILERLAAEGVTSLQQWAALGPRRRQIWGITRRVAAQLDSLAKRRS